MRINRQTLLKIANDAVEQRAHRERGIVSAYMVGSLLEDEYLLGGTADIDLVFIHIDPSPIEREIVRLTDEIHLDIAHYAQKDFRQTRQLRMHPWMGPAIFNCRVLYDPQHFMDFTQASVRGQFLQPNHVMERASQQVEHARQIWASLNRSSIRRPGAQELRSYLKAVEHACNAIASLYGPPLTERRFLQRFPKRAEAAGHSGLYQGLLGLLGAPHLDVEGMQIWMVAWRVCLQAIPAANCPPRLSPYRIPYYQHAFEAQLDSEQPLAMLWPMLRTWTIAASLLPVESDGVAAWLKACEVLGLVGSGFSERLEALDAYLDLVEEVLDEWAQSNGV